MSTIRMALLLALFGLSVSPVSAQPPEIDRTIRKEPVYQTKTPMYGLLAFGPESKDRVWLVLDGATLYVDRNGNGDLTASGKKVLAAKGPSGDPEEDGYFFDVGEVAVGGRTHKGLSVWFVPFKQVALASYGKRPDVKAVLAKDPKALAVSLRLDVEMTWLKGDGIGGRAVFAAGPVDLEGVFQFSTKPGEAPVVRFDDALKITFDTELPSLRVGRGSECTLAVGSTGIGPGTFATIEYEKTVPNNAYPVVELSLPPSTPGGSPLHERFEIKGRC